MPELDDKLREIVLILRGEGALASNAVLLKDTMFSDVGEPESIEKRIAQIKQVFADDAKQKLIDGSIHGVGVYEVEHHESVDWNRMTGQEFYNRFNQLHHEILGIPMTVEIKGAVTEAAKRAAGIEEQQ